MMWAFRNACPSGPMAGQRESKYEGGAGACRKPRPQWTALLFRFIHLVCLDVQTRCREDELQEAKRPTDRGFPLGDPPPLSLSFWGPRKERKEKTTRDGDRRQGRKTEDKPSSAKRKTGQKKNEKTEDRGGGRSAKKTEHCLARRALRRAQPIALCRNTKGAYARTEITRDNPNIAA
jgi:hypothetical protein